jgi:hypothetical protein
MTLTEIDILDEPDALTDARLDNPDDVFEDYGDESDPSPMCNCGECTKGNYTCIRSD